ncbi:MAG: lysophospholipid acyltransferase family protein [Candidatus Velamenicoccus archaeovorus]
MRRRQRGDLNLWWRIGLLIVGLVGRLLFRLRYVGTERIPRTGPAIVAGNHVSALDGIAVALATGERAHRMTRFLAAAEFFAKPQFGWALRSFRQIPLHRGRGDEGALDEAIRTLRSGALAGIFPEGRVNPHPEELQRGRSGLARLALPTGAPVIPVGIWGTQDRWPREGLHLRRPWRPRVAVVYGEPIVPSGDPSDPTDVQAFTDRVMAAIAVQVRLARMATRG